MILGIGLALIAGAFPVGLAFHEQSVDETVAGLLARTAISRVTLLRTRDNQTGPVPAVPAPYDQTYDTNSWWGNGYQGWRDHGYRDFNGQLGVVECFQETTDLQWLFDENQHAGGILTTQGLGANINAWLPKDERTYDADDKYGFQIFYHRVGDPGTGGTGSSLTYVAYAVVQKATPGTTGSSAWDRLPTPRRRTVQNVDTANNSLKLDGGTATVGAILGTVDGAVWNTVRDVDSSGNVYMVDSVSGWGGKQVWVVNNAIDVYAGVVNKQRVRGN
jgi:hypothetical protein